MTDICAGLNTEQRKAASHIDGPLMVLAGAGSGKTRVLTHRIANMMQQGIRPWNILAVTFTNKAAEEMRHRVRLLIGDDADKVWLSTFHSACLRILRRDIDALGIKREFNVYDTGDQKTVVRNILREMNLSIKDNPPRIFMSHIDSVKNVPKTEEETLDDLREEHGELAAEVFRRYQTVLKRNHALDFNDLINHTITLFRQNPGVLWRRQQQFQYLMVDEYQDTNQSQYELIRLLAGERQNLMVVGDDDQSIYGFRGADIRNIQKIQEDFKNVDVIKLEQNYRSTKHILSAANAVICNNRGRMPKTMWTNAEEGPKVNVIESRNAWDEAQAICRKIVNLKRLGQWGCEDIAIIYRTNAASLALEQELMRESIPHVLIGAKKFYERKEIRDILSYMRLLLNPADDIAFLRAIGAPKRGVGEKSLDKLAAFAKEIGLPLLSAAKKWATSKSKLHQTIRTFCSLIDSLRESALKMTTPDHLCRTIIVNSGYEAALLAEHEKEKAKTKVVKTDAERRLENLDALEADLARSWEEASWTTDEVESSPVHWLQEFLDRAALTSPTENIPNADKGAVTLLTAHLAKGLEFPIVFVAGFNEGGFPHYRSMELESEIEEERRLVYVAFTRAKKELHVSLVKSIQKRDRGGLQWVSIAPSRFLGEIPSNLLKGQNRYGRAERLKYSSGTQKSNIPARPKAAQTPKTNPLVSKQTVMTKIPESLEEFQIGVWVHHSTFGKGVIRKKFGAAQNPKLSISFESHGSRLLLARFANLEIVID